ncbi:MAG: hypothetical protein HKL90_06565 [Elusimicrobia bacterium]|nr:hypothetical protein [Elusimicrobiota bacterium]
MRLIPRTLFMRILLLVEGVLLLSSVAVIGLASRTIKTLLMRSQDERAGAVVSLIDGMLTDDLSGLEKQMNAIETMPRVAELSLAAGKTSVPGGLAERLNALAAALGGDIEIARVGGGIVYSTNPSRSLKHGPKERKFMAMAAKGTPLPAQLISDTGGVTLFSSRPLYRPSVKNEASAPRIICTAWIDLDSGWVEEMATRAGSPLALLQGGTVSASSLEDVVGRHWLDYARVSSWPHAFTVESDGGKNYFRMQASPVSVADRNGVPVFLVTGSSLNSLRREIFRIQRSFAVAAAVGGLIVVLTLAYMLWLLSPPLKRLIEASKTISVDGPESFAGVKIVPGDPQEIQTLALHFNRMAGALKNRVESLLKTQAEVRELNASLEARVQEKTAALKDSMTRAFHSEKMSSVGQLAAGVAHEINNPLGVILGFAQGMASRLSADDPYALPLRSIERETLRCKALVQNLLAFSRRGEREFSEVDLRAAVGAALQLVKPRAHLRSVEVREELGVQPLLVWGDSGQLQQVIINLCNNAIDAMPDKGTLTVRLGTSALRPGYSRLEVEDTGSGIPESLREKIFDPFFTTKEPGQGTGLGLALIHEIVTRHSGSVGFRPALGHGTVFHVELPPPPAKPA